MMELEEGFTHIMISFLKEDNAFSSIDKAKPYWHWKAWNETRELLKSYHKRYVKKNRFPSNIAYLEILNFEINGTCKFLWSEFDANEKGKIKELFGLIDSDKTLLNRREVKSV